MEALRIVKTIESDKLPELNKYKGKNVEIIILSDINEKTEAKKDNSILNLRGSLKNKKNELINDLIGSCPDLPDGMEFQKRIRKEWDR
jgi:hypothetical protein